MFLNSFSTAAVLKCLVVKGPLNCPGTGGQGWAFLVLFSQQAGHCHQAGGHSGLLVGGLSDGHFSRWHFHLQLVPGYPVGSLTKVTVQFFTPGKYFSFLICLFIYLSIYLSFIYISVAPMVRICLQCRRPGFDPRVRNILWRREWQPTPVFFPGEFHGQRSLADHSPWGHKESDTTKWLTLLSRFSRVWLCATP